MSGACVSVNVCVSGVCASPIALSGNTRAARGVVVWLNILDVVVRKWKMYTKTADKREPLIREFIFFFLLKL